MLSLFGILALILGSVAPSYALSCTQCVSMTSTSCTGTSVVCPSGNECGAVYASFSGGGLNENTYTMSCLPKERCGTSGSASYPAGAKLKIAAACCSFDNCIPTLPSFPPDSSTPNGLTCRSCMTTTSSWCHTNETTQCTGNENMCILQTTEITGTAGSSSSAYRGCATKSVCNIVSETQTTKDRTKYSKYSCTNGNPGLQKALYLPVALCLFLLTIRF